MAGAWYKMDTKNRNYGPIAVFTAGLCFSIGGILMKVLPWSPFAINGFRCFCSAAVVGLYIKFILKRDLKFNKSIAIGMLAMAGTSTLFALSTKLTTAGNAIILQFTAPIFIMIIEAVAYRRRPHRFDASVCAIVLIGIILFFIDGLSSGHMLGDILALCAGFTYALVMMMNELKDGDGWSSTFLGHVLGMLIGLPFFLSTDFSTSTVRTWSAAIVLGVVQLGIAYILINYGLQTTPPITAVLITGIEPVLNPIWVALFYNEVLTPLSLSGAVIVLVTVMYYNYKKVKS